MAWLERVQSDAVSDERSTTNLLGLFALFGLLLAILGVHGVVAHRVGQRTRELGIRLALAATAGDVIRMFGVTSHDPITFVVSPMLLLIAAMMAALVPALRVSQLDPALTLRQD